MVKQAWWFAVLTTAMGFGSGNACAGEHAVAPAAMPGQAGMAASALAGAWTLVRVENVLPDGRRVPLYGEHPQGLLLIDGQGRYALQMVRGERTRFVSGDKAKGTGAEYRASALEGNAHYGRVQAQAGVLSFRIAHASFPNWDGAVQRRPYTLHGDELSYIVPTPTSGGAHATGEVTWRRLR